MSLLFNLPAYSADGRGGKLEKYKVIDSRRGAPAEILLLCGPDEVATQIETLTGGTWAYQKLSAEGEKKWTHALAYPAGFPRELFTVLDVFTQVVSIPPPPGVDVAISLDWYKVPGGEDDFTNTVIGQCINYTKHAKYPTGSSSRQARRDLIGYLAGFVHAHPLYAAVDAITAPPGHEANGNSFAEGLAQDVARTTRNPFILARADAPRPQQKEGTHQDLTRSFTLTSTVTGRVIVIDDVYRSGATMAGAAVAARRAGAEEVYTLTAARTLRK